MAITIMAMTEGMGRPFTRKETSQAPFHTATHRARQQSGPWTADNEAITG